MIKWINHRMIHDLNSESIKLDEILKLALEKISPQYLRYFILRSWPDN